MSDFVAEVPPEIERSRQLLWRDETEYKRDSSGSLMDTTPRVFEACLRGVGLEDVDLRVSQQVVAGKVEGWLLTCPQFGIHGRQLAGEERADACAEAYLYIYRRAECMLETLVKGTTI